MPLRTLIRRWTVALTALVAVCILPVPAAADYRTFEVEGLRIVFDSDWATRMA